MRTRRCKSCGLLCAPTAVDFKLLTLDRNSYISKIASILTQFFEELHEMTDWVFTILMGGPDPAMGGVLDISSFHVGATKNNNRFSQTYPDFTQRVMAPYTQFVECVFRELIQVGSRGLRY